MYFSFLIKKIKDTKRKEYCFPAKNLRPKKKKNKFRAKFRDFAFLSGEEITG